MTFYKVGGCSPCSLRQGVPPKVVLVSRNMFLLFLRDLYPCLYKRTSPPLVKRLIFVLNLRNIWLHLWVSHSFRVFFFSLSLMSNLGSNGDTITYLGLFQVRSNMLLSPSSTPFPLHLLFFISCSLSHSPLFILFTYSLVSLFNWIISPSSSTLMKWTFTHLNNYVILIVRIFLKFSYTT